VYAIINPYEPHLLLYYGSYNSLPYTCPVETIAGTMPRCFPRIQGTNLPLEVILITEYLSRKVPHQLISSYIDILWSIRILLSTSYKISWTRGYFNSVTTLLPLQWSWLVRKMGLRDFLLTIGNWISIPSKINCLSPFLRNRLMNLLDLLFTPS